MATEAQINGSIDIWEGQLVHYTLGAAIQDQYGNWNQAECFLNKATNTYIKIWNLESICPDAEKEILPNALSCDLSQKGIGVWAIESPVAAAAIGCSVLQLADGQGPPPYGEFTQQEFVTNEFTEVITN